MFPGDSLLENLPLAYNKTLELCNSLALLYEAPDGIILCNGGNISTQMEYVTSTNKLGTILVSSVPIILLKLIKFSCPCVVIREDEAQVVVAYAEEANRPNVSMKFKETILEIKNATMVPRYSSRGPSPSFLNILKLDVIALGFYVLGASIREEVTTKSGFTYLKSDYAIATGTSWNILCVPSCCWSRSTSKKCTSRQEHYGD